MADKENPLVALRLWRRLPVVLAGVMALLCAASLLGLPCDDRTPVNAPVRLKPSFGRDVRADPAGLPTPGRAWPARAAGSAEILRSAR
jgi:hypothetical protein